MLFYDNVTFDVGYNKQLFEVDNMRYHVVHDNHWLNLTLNKIANYVLCNYLLSAVFVKILCFCKLVKHFYLLQALYQ